MSALGGKQTSYVQALSMGAIRRSEATLGFYGDDLDPNEITLLLGAAPTVGVAKGDYWATTLAAQKLAYTGSWRLHAGTSEPQNLKSQIANLLDPITAELSVWHDLALRFRAVMFCGLWLETYNDGLELCPGTMSLLAERRLILDLDIYGAGPD